MKNVLEEEHSVMTPLLSGGKKSPKNEIVLKFATIASDMKGCLRLFYFHILNITKFG
jgi:hypothetical protein